ILELEGVRPSPIAPSRTLQMGRKKVFVFDEVFTETFVESFGIFLLRQNYQYRPSFDNELSAAMTAELIQSLPAMPEVADAIVQRYHPEMTATPADQVLSHGYSAAIRFGDSCAMHQDVACEDCVTFLYYGNLVWNAAWGGETMFYDDELSSAACVLPRPGRLILFNAAVHHRAGVPTRDCPSFRYGLSLFYRCPRMLQELRAGTAQRT
ncbi:MAG TPA: 2OG-Fe(II) oxygenase, partial [Kofleriaceae bacterium]|nr:2OG-Fe(II) oxygenase [Kofleriaceae bacterium]